MITRVVSSVELRMERLLKRVLKPLFRDYVYTVHYGPAQGFRVMGDLGFLQARITDRDRFWMGLDLAGKTVYNAGGHIGIRTLFFSRAVGETGQVISFEPNPEAFAILRANVEMNGLANVRLVNQGLAERRDIVLLVYGRADSGLGTMNSAKQARLINNKQGIKIAATLVEVCPLDEYIRVNSLPDPDFVKLDVEGYEYNVLLGMQETLRRCKPFMEIEIHRATKEHSLVEDVKNIITLLVPHGYEIRDLSSRRVIGEGNVEQVRGVRHLICTANGVQDR